MIDQSSDLFRTHFTFKEEHPAIPADMRPLWRISALLLILSESRGRKASIKKMQVLNWAIRTLNGQLVVERFLKGEIKPQDVVIRFDPGFPIAVELMRASGFVSISGGKTLKLEEKGAGLIKIIQSDENCMSVEKQFLKSIKPFFLESRIASLISELK